MFDMCKLFGHEAILFMSNGDKARITLGLAPDNLQVPILMHMAWKVTLIDHDFVVGPQQKLIKYVYRICKVTKLGAILYRGNSFIKVQSGKHNTSCLWCKRPLLGWTWRTKTHFTDENWWYGRWGSKIS